MDLAKSLYKSVKNPLLIKPERPLPREVAVVGAGTIGPDIAYYLKTALPDINLHLIDVSEDQLHKAQNRLSGYASEAVNSFKIKEEQAKEILNNIYYSTDYSEMKNADLVIETATENIFLKRKIVSQIESVVSEDTIITSSTSSIPADRIFAEMKKPGRATVTHFFAPAWRSLPVEIIAWEKVQQEALDYLMWMFAKTGKVPIMTDNVICFMFDRIFDNWCNEAGHLLENATASEVDTVAEEFVYAGPFFVLNLARGNPIIFETNSLQMEEGEHYRPSPIFPSVKEWHTKKPGIKHDTPQHKISLIRDRLLGIVFSQSFDIIDRGIGTPEDLNFGCQIALGFRNGPMDMMKKMGEKEVERIMNAFTAERGNFPYPKVPINDYLAFKRHIIIDDI